MLSSPVWRERSRSYFAVGLCLGGVSTALLAVCVGSLLLRPFTPDGLRIAVLAGLAAFVAAGEFGLHRVLLPHRREQVPTSVIGEGSDLGALRFGYEMGTGLRTHMPSNLPYVALASAVLVAAAVPALLIGLGFGLGRAWMALGRHHGRDADRWDGQWRRRSVLLRRVLAVKLVVLLVALLTD